MPGSIIAVEVLGLVAGTFAATATAFAINIVASAIISKIFAPKPSGADYTSAPNPGQRQQLSPATDNKLPVIYGTAYTGGIVVDMSITSDNQDIYWVLALCEVTGAEYGSADDISFGNIYWGGRLCVFGDATDHTKVTGLIDESTNTTDTAINGYMNIYLYKNGSSNPVNTTQTAIQVLSNSNLVYQWDSNKKMNNCAFAIIHLKYSQQANTTGLSPTKFQVNNARTKVGDCVYDYFRSSRYGCALTDSQIDSSSLTTLTNYCEQSISYIDYNGVTQTLPQRFRFDGLLDTSTKCLDNLQLMANSADFLIRYNEIKGMWGAVTQQPTYTVAMPVNDSVMTSALQISSIDVASTFNILEVQFPDKTNKDSFNSSTYDLRTIAPSTLYPNEPVNKQSVQLHLVNNDIRAQLIANRLLKSNRLDLQIQVEVNYSGIQLEAGDFITITQANYGFNAKLFRVLKVTENFGSDGRITAKLSLQEADTTVWADISVKQYTPPVKTGIPNALSFGTIPSPVVTNPLPNAPIPSFQIMQMTSSQGLIQYANFYASLMQNPTMDSQLVALGSSAIAPSGVNYATNTALPLTTITALPAGDWYLFSRMVNTLGSSGLSAPSAKFSWRPFTTQFATRYLVVVYADTPTTGFSLTPANKAYFGIRNQADTTVSTNYSDYIWFLANPAFSTNNYFLYANFGARRFSYSVGLADYASGTGAFVPSNTALYDASLWSALEGTLNVIDLDARTGQVLQQLTTVTGVASGELATTNAQGGVGIASLSSILNFGGASSTFLSGPNITIDKYGRIIGFSATDPAYLTISNFTATAGQTVFNVTRSAGYITGQCWVYVNGLLVNPSTYTDNAGNVTFNTGRSNGDWVCVVSFRNLSSSAFYEDLGITVSSVSGATVNFSMRPWQIIKAGDIITFANTGSPTQYTVASTTNTSITFTSNPTVSAGANIYRYLASSAYYPAFSRWSETLSSTTTFTPVGYAVHSGYEFLFVAGMFISANQYNLSSGNINFNASQTGNLLVVNMSANNLGQPTFGAITQTQSTTATIATYSVPTYVASALLVYYNGTLLRQGTQYTTTSDTSITLTTTPTVSTDLITVTIFTSSGVA